MNEQRPPSSPSVEIPVRKRTRSLLFDASEFVTQAEQSCAEWLADKSYTTISDLIRFYYPTLRGEMSPMWDAQGCRTFLLQKVRPHLLWISLMEFSADNDLKLPRQPEPPRSMDSMVVVTVSVEYGHEGAPQWWQPRRLLVGLTVATAAAAAAATALLYLSKPQPQTLKVETWEAQPEARSQMPVHVPHLRRQPSPERKAERLRRGHQNKVPAHAKVPYVREQTQSSSQIAQVATGITYVCDGGRQIQIRFPMPAAAGSAESLAFVKQAAREGKRRCKD